MALLYRAFAEILRTADCRFERQVSYEIWSSPITQGTFAVPANIDGRAQRLDRAHRFRH